MKCPNCGATLPKGSSFCKNCNSELPKKSSFFGRIGKIPVIIGAAAVGAAAVCVLFMLLTDVPSVKYEKLPEQIRCISSAFDFSFFDRSGNKTDTLTNIHRGQTNGLGMMLAAGTDSSLYLERDGKAEKLDTGVAGSHIFGLAECSAVAYYEKDKKIYRYSGSSEMIGAIEGFDKFIVISPHGDAAVWGESVRNELKISAYRGGKTELLSGADSVFSVGDDGFIYGQKGQTLVVCGGDSAEFTEVCGCGTIKSVSADCGQVLFNDDGPPKTYMYDRALGVRILVYDGTAKPYSPDGMRQEPDNFELFIGEATDHKNGSFSLMLFERDGTKYKARKLLDLDNVSSYSVSADGRRLLYIKDSKLTLGSTVSSFGKDNVIAENVFDLYADPMFENIYFRTVDNTLYYSDGGSPKKISLNAGAACMACDGVCTFVSDDILYFSENGGSLRKAEGVGKVKYLTSDFAVSDDGKKYITYDGKNYIDSGIVW